MNAHQTLLLRRYFEANRVFHDVRDEIPMTIMNTFLGVTIWGHDEKGRETPLMIKELASKIGLPYTTVSRHLRYLGQAERTGRPGAGLVATEMYIHDNRQKVVSLTDKGKTVRDRVLFALGERD